MSFLLSSYLQQSLDDFAEVFAIRSIAAGEPILYDYGVKSNFELLMAYGFALEENPYDKIDLAASEGELLGLLDYSGDSPDSGDSDEDEEGGGGVTEDEKVAAMQEAVAAVQALVNTTVEQGELGEVDVVEGNPVNPMFDVSREKGLALWSRGMVDPRLLAALTALVYVTKQRTCELHTVAALLVLRGVLAYALLLGLFQPMRFC